MLFYVDVTVVCALPDERGVTPIAERTWHDTVSCRFAINASNSDDAIANATDASRRAVDRDGRFVGGVVTKASPTPITPEELNGYDPYLIRPLGESGVVYVSGITYGSVRYAEVPDVHAELMSMRDAISADGLPEPSFIHPFSDFTYEPMVCRLLCPGCDHWVEFDQRAFMLAFIDGLQHMPREYKRLQSAIRVYQPFVSRHRECFPGTAAIELDLRFLYGDDEEFSSLDDAMCEGQDPWIKER